jgi:hypothetical protein
VRDHRQHEPDDIAPAHANTWVAQSLAANATYLSKNAGLVCFGSCKLLKRSRKRQLPHDWTENNVKVADAFRFVSKFPVLRDYLDNRELLTT